MVKFSFSKGIFILFAFLLISFGVVYAYGGNNPLKMGHNWKSVNFDDEFCKIVTGNDCVKSLGSNSKFGHEWESYEFDDEFCNLVSGADCVGEFEDSGSRHFGVDGSVLHSVIDFPELVSELGDVASGVNAICYYEDNPVKTQQKLDELDEFYE